MTTALEIIGGIALILGAVAGIPPAASALIRSCIPVAAALRDLRQAFSSPSKKASKSKAS